MHIKEIYKAIYERLDTLTPLPVDCGNLCGKLCCQPSEEDEVGMYLFPGEEALFKGLDGFRILDSEFTYKNGKNAKLICCTRPCERSLRPLSCRIFPLIPYFRHGSPVRIILDPRATICPLTHPEASPYIECEFKREVTRAFRLLSRFSEIADFLDALTDILDDYNKLRGYDHAL
ncbi:MAG: hypothetical protein IJB48_07380 [Clostridia bacterium]|nr:hypothetical protein [Clostridia bacterium]